MRDAATNFLKWFQSIPFFDIGGVFYRGANDTRIKSLQTIEIKCLKTIYGPKAWPGINSAHRDNNLLLCHERRELNMLKYAHRK